MANNTVYPYGTDGQLPASIGIINDLTTGGADKALSAEMGKQLNEVLGTMKSVPRANTTTNAVISKADGSIVSAGVPSAYVADFAFDGVGTPYASGRIGVSLTTCMVAYFNAGGTFLGYEIASSGTGTNIVDYKLTPPAGTSKIRVGGNDSLGGVVSLTVLVEDTLIDKVNDLEKEVGQGALSLMTYNIGHFSGGVSPNSTITSSDYVAKVNAFRALLSDEAPDIYGVVEYSVIFGKDTDNQNVNTKDALFGLATTQFESSQLHYACYALFANRLPIYNVQINDFECLENETITHTSVIEAQDYRYISADLYAFGVDIKLVVTHFAFDQNRPGVLQQKQLEELMTVYDGSPYVLIMGDFNYNVEDMQATVTAAGYAMANEGQYKTVPSAEKGRLDNILVKGLQIVATKMITSNLSDHNPLLARITK